MGPRIRLRCLGAAAALLWCGAIAAQPSVPGPGERLYREGLLASGKPVRGERQGAPPLVGHDAACAHCHRRSGLGTVEGRIVIPPISGPYLFHPGERVGRGGAQLTGRVQDPKAYDEATLARAIRDGIGSDGRSLDYLMPRFRIDDDSMRELIAYLKGLSSGPQRGAGPDVLDFATIVTPDADPAVRDAMLDVIEKFFVNRNAFYHGDGKAPPLQSARRIHFRVERRWQLHVWNLQGSPATWEEQLDRDLQAEPVFAVISGLAGATWEPVHRFCERRAVPCLFPNVDLPVVAPADFYPLYFSQGVLLEAQLVATRLAQSAGSDGAGGRLVQVFREGDVGAAAAARLREAAPRRALVDRPLAPAGGPGELAQALADVKPADTLVLWLRAADLAALPAPPPGPPAVYVSGLMGGLEHAPLAAAWRAATRMTYPYELPEARRVRMSYPLDWFNIRHIPVVDERVQSDTYIACAVVAEALHEMVDDLVPEYLIERLEVMLSSRVVNGYYTRLSLAPGQRFASKGGYLVRFAGAAGTQLAADGDWIVP
jgi:hypothetical protein